jgi:hypothetical protein
MADPEIPDASFGTICKIVGDLQPSSSGEYVTASFFFGHTGGFTMQLAGMLRMTVGEWQIFGAALSMGAKQTRGHLQLLIDDPLSRERTTKP